MARFGEWLNGPRGRVERVFYSGPVSKLSADWRVIVSAGSEAYIKRSPAIRKVFFGRSGMSLASARAVAKAY